MATSQPAAEPRRFARLRVNHGAIVENWRYFQKLAPTAEAAAVVKADAYGLGSVRASRALAEAGVRTFYTATCAEGVIVRQALGPGPRIMVLDGPTGGDCGALQDSALIPVLNSLAQANMWANRGPAVLHIDTGMNRLGIGPDELAAAAVALKAANLTHVMSHLACSSEPSHPLNDVQRKRFIDAATLFPQAPLSLAATAGCLMGGAYHFDMVRIGVGLYGSGGLDVGNPKLAIAATIEAPILQVRTVEAGESFGYGATFTATKKMRTATVALGYADGYLRSLSAGGYGVLEGAKRRILGRVSMDLIIVDVTDCKGAEPGVMVEFLGANAPLDELAEIAGTASYEILTTFAGTVRKTGGRG